MHRCLGSVLIIIMEPQFVFRFIVLTRVCEQNSSHIFQMSDTCFSLSTLRPAVMMVFFKHLQQELRPVLEAAVLLNQSNTPFSVTIHGSHCTHDLSSLFEVISFLPYIWFYLDKSSVQTMQATFGLTKSSI